MKISINSKIPSSTIENGVYQNLEKTPMMTDDASYVKIFRKQFKAPKSVSPQDKIPSVTTDLKNFYSEKPAVIWFGHSSYLIHCRGINILVDPVFCGYASPFPFMMKAFEGANTYGVEEMPTIDFHLQTHNHYDHLDKKSIKALRSKTNQYLVPKGVKKDMLNAKIAEEKITELDWGSHLEISEEIKITATPARHFSGRGLKRNTSLWSSYILELFGYKIFIGGDSGYGKHFKEIGNAFEKFDLAILECGQYGEYWPLIHTQPEEIIEVTNDLNAEVILPVHWAKFKLAYHPWQEPIERLLKVGINKKIATPQIGEPLILEEKLPQTQWWKDIS